jgi:hypothetical protein|tara:strand:- start:47 stop:220 length:174 start_codon:yes stop_codon:yes gene_type:complete
MTNRYLSSLNHIKKDAIDCLHAATPQDRISVLEEFDDWLFAEDEDYEVLWLPKGEEM